MVNSRAAAWRPLLCTAIRFHTKRGHAPAKRSRPVLVSNAWARPEPVVHRCPHCASEDVRTIAETEESTYLRCGTCLSIWRQDRVDGSADTAERRRQTDRRS